MLTNVLDVNGWAKMSRLALIIMISGILGGCNPDHEFIAQKRILVTDPLISAGRVAIGERLTINVQLRSEGAAPVTISDIYIENDDSEAFVLMDWVGEDGETLQLESGSEENPTIMEIAISFRPDAEGYYHATMVIASNDTEVERQDGEEQAIWKVRLRGIAEHACGRIVPSYVDFGKRAIGGTFYRDLTIYNCGEVILTIAKFDNASSPTFWVDSFSTVSIVPGQSDIVQIAWVPSSLNPDSTTISLVSNDPMFNETVEVIGNNCELSSDKSWDVDGDGWFSCGGDCNDTDSTISPSAVENTGNSKDDDCDGSIDEASNPVSDDRDGDGYSENQGDCNDTDKTVNPGAIEVFNQIDDNCDDKVDNNTNSYDDDGDGFSEDQGDCDDTNVLIYPREDREENIDGKDNDCDGVIDEGGDTTDDDNDGFSEEDGDCDDDDPWSYPDGVEDCDDADNNCNNDIDEDDACNYLIQRDTGIVVVEKSCNTGVGVFGWIWLAGLGVLLKRRKV